MKTQGDPNIESCVQVRRHKCDAVPDEQMDEREVHCSLRPSVESFCAVARSIQLSHGLHDQDVRFFLAADDAEVYEQVILLPPQKSYLVCTIPKRPAAKWSHRLWPAHINIKSQQETARHQYAKLKKAAISQINETPFFFCEIVD